MNIISNFSFGILPKFQKPQYFGMLPENSENQKALNNELNKIAMVNKSQVNFCGKGFDFSKKDLMFLSGLTSVFGLSSVIANKLKNKLGDFLQANQLKSIDDIAGNENLLMQLDLIDALNEITNFEGKNYSKLVDNVVNRCDQEVELQPDSFKCTTECEINDDENDDISGEFDFELENFVKKSIERIKQNDKKCLEAIGVAFEFNKEQQKKLEDIVNQILKENHLSCLKGLESEDMIETESIMVEKIVDEFGLSDDDNTIITMEITNRTLAKESDYEPSISPLDRNKELINRDLGMLNKIMKQNGFNSNDIEVLSIAMKKDAYENGFKSIFNLFDNGNDFSKYINVNEVLNSKRFADRKIDLLIDLNLTAKNIQNKVAKLEQNNKSDNLNSMRVNAFICELDNLYDFSKEDLKNVKRFITKSGKYDFGNRQNINKIAYELSEYLHKESDYANIVEIEKRIAEMSQDDLDAYKFKYLQLMIKK